MWQNLWHTMVTQRGQIWEALLQHIGLSLLSLLIAAAIAIPLAIILTPHKKIAEGVLQITSVMQTIPSLALLGILIPFVGIGTVPSVIALVVYAVMPIFQSTYSGLSEIDPSLQEAATAFGLPRWMRLFRIDLPLAMPTIIGGLRVALVLIIGTATLAALIGAGGLGTYILLGIETNNNSYLIIGAVLSALLAIFFSALIRWLGRLSLRRMVEVVAIAVALIAGAAGYQSYTAKTATITIAGKLGSEPDILINMYKELIEQQDHKLQVVTKPNFGATSFLFKALQSNQIQVYPEFTGTVTQTILKSHTKTSHNPQQTYEKARAGLSSEYQMSYLKPMKYQNGYDLAVTQQFAKKYDLKTISDLREIATKLHAGFDPDFDHQKDGYPGLQKAYNLQMGSIRTMEPSIRYKALVNGKVNVVDGYTTDAEIQQYHLVVLKDDLHYFPPYQGAPLLKTSTLKKYPALKPALNKLANQITEKDMQTMNYDVQVKHEKASTVAHHYLLTHHLLK
ncbi:ABC transporter permease/substrate-binding protein [Levilactobacillus bambusae]|uniref:Glycine/betaine ABC transporter permease n=1 Tax=Levilactobacillus bambusae TaxID=2024736 RepID=A0A2V1N0M0_9LACO|nr:ABC transporter permease/substrate-binding protein [Levilactobacillus bambusae]PWG00288.1 glycine/betaine ABC transporter permease [Levilactobacillus bambusae]